MSQAIIIVRGKKTIHDWENLSLDRTSVYGLNSLSNNQRELNSDGICCFIGPEKIISISRSSTCGTKLETWIITKDK